MRACYSLMIILFCACNRFTEKEKIEICLKNADSIKVTKVTWDNVPFLSRIDGDWVEIEGVFTCGFEDVSINSSKNPHSSVGIWINFKNQIEMQDDKLQKMSGKKAIVYGRLNVSDKGHLSGYNASLDSAYCIKEE